MAILCVARAWLPCLAAGVFAVACLGVEDAPKPDAKPDAVAPAQAEEKPAADEPDPPPADIFAAAKAGNLEAVKKFLDDNPALLNAKTKLADTPLHWAASCGRIEVVKLLLSRKPDVNAKNITGSTPLHMACRIANKAIVELLLAAKTDVNAKAEGEDEEGETPLHIVVRRGNIELAELLLKNKADVGARLTTGVTVLQLAKKRGRTDMLKLLRQHGAHDPDDE
jgi:ankyrin repeat protein